MLSERRTRAAMPVLSPDPRASRQERSMSDPKEKKRPAIAEGYIPSWSNSPESQFTSHETACLLNTRTKTRVEITAYFSDREPVGPYHITVPVQRTLQRARGPGPHTAWHRLCERDRVRHSDSGAAYQARLAAGREPAALHCSVREQRLAGCLWLTGMGIQEDQSLRLQPIQKTMDGFR